MAADVGAKLLAEVEEMGLEEILQDIVIKQKSAISAFDFPPLNHLVQAAAETWPSNNILTAHPIVELLSFTVSGGKTQLLYHLCARAVLPEHLGGRQSTVAVVDPDGRFSIDRLSTEVQTLLRRDDSIVDSNELDENTLSALRHVHLFRPQSLASTVATLRALPDYLFAQKRHHSIDREVALIAVDAISTFYWQDRSQTDNASFLAATGEGFESTRDLSGYKQFFDSLKVATKALSCPAIVTTWDLSPPQFESKGSRSYRQQLPDFKPNLRLVVRRMPVRHYPPRIDVEHAQRESVDRQSVVDQNRFECFINHHGLEERHLQAFNGRNGGFRFAIEEDCVKIEEEAQQEDPQG